MSSYVVGDAAINRVCAYLYWDPDHSTDVLKRRLREAGFALEPEDLGKAMHALNVRATGARYPQFPGDLPGSPEAYRYSNMFPPTAIAALKSLRCWLYQCTEGNCDEDPLYKAMDEASKLLALHIACTLPAYEKAPWG